LAAEAGQGIDGIEIEEQPDNQIVNGSAARTDIIFPIANTITSFLWIIHGTAI
jgi:hypothetical protein